MSGVERRIEAQDWMVSWESRAVMAALSARGQDVRFVGGCVRDAVLGRPVKDIDIATPDHPETVMKLLNKAGLKVIPTGLDHGTVTAVSNHVPFEITTLRLDVETNGRHATVAFTGSWEKDAARRDLTMNALSCRPDGTIFDYYGGLDDLARGCIRFVGDAHARIREDALRLLRYFRFFAHYGGGQHDAGALAACRDLKSMVRGLSAERIRTEWVKLLDARDPLPVLEVMEQLGVLGEFLPEGRDLGPLKDLLDLQGRMAVTLAEGFSPLVRLASLYPNAPDAPDECQEKLCNLPNRLRFSKIEREFFCDALMGQQERSLQELRADSRLFFYQQDRNLAAAKLLLAGSNTGEIRLAAELLDELFHFRKPAFPLQGRDLIMDGFEKGPRIGETLRRVELWWVANDFLPDREACMNEARQS